MKRKLQFVIVLLSLIFIFQGMIRLDLNASGTDPEATLNVAVDPTLPPFQFEENGKLTGLNIDILNSIAAENNFKINYMPMNKDVSIEKLLNGEIDLILGLRYDAVLSEEVEYTESIVQSVVCMIAKPETHREMQAMLNTTPYVASVENNSTELDILSNIRRVNFNVAFNQEDAFQLLIINRADFFIGVKDTAEYLLNKYGLSKQYKIIDSYMTPVEYFIAASPENEKYVILINSGLSRLKLNGEYEKLYVKWIENSEVNIARRLKYVIFLSLACAVIVSIVFLIVATWNMKLKEQVNLKTEELSKINLDLKAQIIETRNNIELKNLICESSPRAIAIFDLEGNISMFNDSALQIASLTTRPIDKSIYDIEPMSLMVNDAIDKVLKDNTSYTCDEFIYVKGGREFTYRYVMYPLYDFDKKLRGIIITIEDITEEKKIKNQILERDKNRALVQIVAGLSHEIRNPLTTIKTFIELIPTKIENKKFKEEVTVVVPEEINRVNNLIESLIDYAKPRSQNKTNSNAEKIANSCVALFKPVLEQNDINITADIDSNLYIYCDKSQIKQALINFLLNSIDAIIEKKELHSNSDYQGKIDIKGYAYEGEIILKIEDNGIGMDSTEIERAYDMFYTTKEKGTGLGIPLSIQMLHANNCKVSIKGQKGEFAEITLCFTNNPL